MNFLEQIVARLGANSQAPVLGEVHPDGIVTVTGGQLQEEISSARHFLRERGLRPGDRCALFAPNSIHWVATDLAILAEGLVSVPLYFRQAPAEIAVMIRDSGAAHVCCGDETLRDALRHAMPDMPANSLLGDAFRAPADPVGPLQPLPDSAPVTIIYTSGTSGEPKGVVLTAGNVGHMLGCTASRLNLLMGPRAEPERVFHWPPFSFAASWIMLLSALSRNSLLLLSTDLNRLPDEIRVAQPEYFLNVPTLLERLRRRVEEQIAQRGGIVARLFARARQAAVLRGDGNASLAEAASLYFCRRAVFPKIRGVLGPRLKALICGSAPLAVETQRFFQMLSIPVLQAYGLTETTAICTLDDPRAVEPGRVGRAVPGVEMKLGADQEILVRGPNVFAGYWNRPEETAHVLRDDGSTPATRAKRMRAAIGVLSAA